MNTGNGLYLPNSDASSTADFNFHPFPPDIKTARRENSTASEIPPDQYHYLISLIDGLNLKVSELEKSAQTTNCFSKQAVLLQRICIIVIFLLPIIVVAAASGVVWWLSTDETLVNCAKWYLGILGLAGVIDLVAIFLTEKFRSARIEDLERRVGNLEK